MAKYSKQLHYRKYGKVIDIPLYTSPLDVGPDHIIVKDTDGTLLYASLGIEGTDLTIRKNGQIYKVIGTEVAEKEGPFVQVYGDDWAWAYIATKPDGSDKREIMHSHYTDPIKKWPFTLDESIDKYYLLVHVKNEGGPYIFYNPLSSLYNTNYKFELSDSQTISSNPWHWYCSRDMWDTYWSIPFALSVPHSANGFDGLWYPGGAISGIVFKDVYFMTPIVRK